MLLETIHVTTCFEGPNTSFTHAQSLSSISPLFAPNLPLDVVVAYDEQKRFACIRDDTPE